MDSQSFAVRFNENNQELILSGVLRPEQPEDLRPLRQVLQQAAQRVAGTLFVNLKRLTGMNHAAFLELGRLVRGVGQAHPGLRIKLVYSSAVTWAGPRLGLLAQVLPTVSVEQYDRAFYPGQGVIEDEGLIPVLRAQTAVLWNHEKALLHAHGLKPDMRVADICCGLGDFAVLVKKEFKPAEIVAVDHSKPFLEYAHRVARDFGLDGIQYRYGDAANLFLEDNSFDFVTARLALQIFNKPEAILKELFRICKPGGRVYVTNEMMGHIHGYPHADRIAWAYELVPRMAAGLGMDVNFGPKSRAYLHDAGLEDVRVDLMEISNLNSDVEEFSKVAESWLHYVTTSIAPATGQDAQTMERLRQGLTDYLSAVQSRRGFAGWPVYVASGCKPSRAGH